MHLMPGSLPGSFPRVSPRALGYTSAVIRPLRGEIQQRIGRLAQLGPGVHQHAGQHQPRAALAGLAVDADHVAGVRLEVVGRRPGLLSESYGPEPWTSSPPSPTTFHTTSLPRKSPFTPVLHQKSKAKPLQSVCYKNRLGGGLPLLVNDGMDQNDQSLVQHLSKNKTHPQSTKS